MKVYLSQNKCLIFFYNFYSNASITFTSRHACKLSAVFGLISPQLERFDKVQQEWSGKYILQFSCCHMRTHLLNLIGTCLKLFIANAPKMKRTFDFAGAETANSPVVCTQLSRLDFVILQSVVVGTSHDRAGASSQTWEPLPLSSCL
jgi:hypothetical protein